MDTAQAHLDRIASTLTKRGAGWSPGSPGYSMPHFAGEPLLIPAEDAQGLVRYGITLEGEPGRGNLVCLDAVQPPLAVTLRLAGCSDTRIAIGRSHPFSGRFAFNGEGSTLMVAGMGEMGGGSKLRLTLGPGSSAYLGEGLTSVSSDWIVEGSERSLVIGDDLMASWGISVRNFDSHALFDLDERRVINSAADIHIGPHCWIGQDAKILRGVTLGAGSVIGAGAIVVGNVPPASAVAGSPARVVRSNVSWTRSGRPSDKEMERVAALLSVQEKSDAREA